MLQHHGKCGIENRPQKDGGRGTLDGEQDNGRIYDSCQSIRRDGALFANLIPIVI